MAKRERFLGNFMLLVYRGYEHLKLLNIPGDLTTVPKETAGNVPGLRESLNVSE